MRERLSPSDISARLQELDGWALEEGDTAITKVFKFADFAEAMGFMTRCAIFADRIDHHPEWKNVYRMVEVRLSTHSAKGLTELDFKLAAFMDKASH